MLAILDVLNIRWLPDFRKKTEEPLVPEAEVLKF
jgi:hypothetical protein